MFISNNTNIDIQKTTGGGILKDKDLNVLGHFRKNARESLTRLSKTTKIPVSTIYDRLKDYEKHKVIRKHTSLLDFKKMGYDVRIKMLLTASKDKKGKLKKYLHKHPRVNNLYRVSNGYDYMAELIFKNIEELDVFSKKLENYDLEDKKEFFVLEELKKEEFLTHTPNLGVRN